MFACFRPARARDAGVESTKEAAGTLREAAPGTALTAPSSRDAEPLPRTAVEAGGTGKQQSENPITEMDAANVSECDATAITEGLCLAPKLLGRGTYGIVIKGTFHGLPVAVKIMTSQGLNRAALRELLLGPSLVHPNCVASPPRACTQTYSSRCARLTHRFFDLLEGPRPSADDRPQPRQLQPITYSGEGFGDPEGMGECGDPLPVLHSVLYTLQPANVLLKSSRDDRRGFNAKVGDIGLAHVLPVAATSMTSDSWGSVAYMSPEAFRGRVSRAGDIWSFSILLWEALTGERPYPHMEPGEVAAGVQAGRLRLKWPTLEPLAQPLVELGLLCMHTDPLERPTAKNIMQRLIQIEAAVRAQIVLPPTTPSPPSSADPSAGSQRAQEGREEAEEGAEVKEEEGAAAAGGGEAPPAPGLEGRLPDERLPGTERADAAAGAGAQG
ncbi:Mitogen-activated protein kinase kinase kinase 10 [Tetrabaena socialis]|uniref:Mitogen-activated protein kinase kinase kinase 10 n=1 Tax=Tetrabaena socialis TaxID=47790 RepID=A0A2J8A589_9CHLO|nr:Mitogen-activated protein kinase kinase kinase 10 [Tetrabaena socialis]|eukprot:PNH07663.1 Mitogen-activated protein kinase kinase kinase 10 [Tetrabaena socialis]